MLSVALASFLIVLFAALNSSKNRGGYRNAYATDIAKVSGWTNTGGRTVARIWSPVVAVLCSSSCCVVRYGQLSPELWLSLQNAVDSCFLVMPKEVAKIYMDTFGELLQFV